MKVWKTNKASIGNAKIPIYIDDIIAIDQSFGECLLTVVETIILFQKLDFVIHPDKSYISQNSRISWLYYCLRKPYIYEITHTKKIIRNVASFQQEQNWQEENLLILLVLSDPHFQETSLVH